MRLMATTARFQMRNSSVHWNGLLCCRRESHADALEEKTADQMSMMYIQTVEAELRKFRCAINYRHMQAQDCCVGHYMFHSTNLSLPANAPSESETWNAVCISVCLTTHLCLRLLMPSLSQRHKLLRVLLHVSQYNSVFAC